MLKILIAIDGSDLALDAVRYALRLAQNGLQISSVVLANVQEPASLYELVTTRDPELIAAASIEAGEHLIAPARALLEATGLECESAVGVGDPAHTLVDIIETAGCDLVLIGARGQGAISSALLGSVSQELAHASPVPVTIVRHVEALSADEAGDVLDADGQDGGAAGSAGDGALRQIGRTGRRWPGRAGGGPMRPCETAPLRAV